MIFNSKLIKNTEGLEIYTESVGKPEKPAVVLIMGAMNQGLFWYDSFCQTLVDDGHYVIRFDHRDTGFSSIVDFEKNPYNLDDLTNDVVEILDGYKISKAHIIGISMGGYIAQLMAIKFPDKLETLTLISTTADHRPYMDATMSNFNNKYELPYPNTNFIKYIDKSKSNPPKNDEEFRNNQIEGWKIFFGHKLNRKDLNELKRLIDLSNKRNKNRFSPFNHGLAVANSEDRLELVKKIKTPTFIIHGKNDICFPIEHGRFLHKNISNSKLEIVEGLGHMFSFSESNTVALKILSNIY